MQCAISFLALHFPSADTEKTVETFDGEPLPALVMPLRLDLVTPFGRTWLMFRILFAPSRFLSIAIPLQL
jgi:hypothetical protein